MHQELEKLEDIAKSRREDAAYTKQYFTVSRQAHVRSTQSFGTPTLVWHVAFWPKRQFDPQNLDDPTSGFPTRGAARGSYNHRRAQLAEDLDRLLEKLQRKGRVPKRSGRFRDESFKQPAKPADWETGSKQVPVGAVATESIAFTLWWSDTPRETCPEAPNEDDLRVRVQADIHPDFATVTFIIDAGKRWDRPPLFVGEDADAGAPVPGKRRQSIFEAVRAVRGHAAGRFGADPRGAADLLPESDVSAAVAQELLSAGNLLYNKVWDEFCKEFDCSIVDLAGSTDKVFANFRGVVLSAPVNREATPAQAPESRFKPYRARDDLDDPFPNAVVKAYWPFIRRTRSEADHRDWIACGVFDWRALYITALGGKSDFDPGDEARIWDAADADKAALAELGAETTLTSDAPVGYLPRRALNEGERVEAMQRRLDAMHVGDNIELRRRINGLREGLEISETAQGDRPAPFRYLFLTSGEPHRRQVGRMVDRVNLLGTVRLYAMKNFSIIRDADVHIRIYGQLLDQIMRKTTDDTNKSQQDWWKLEIPNARQNLIGFGASDRALTGLKREAELRQVFTTCMAALDEENAKLEEWTKGSASSGPGAEGAELLANERPLMLYRRLLDDIAAAAPEDTKLGQDEENIFARARKALNEARKAKSRHDEDLAQINRQADLRLIQIKTHIDELGQDSIGGLPFRINRSRYYADMFRSMVEMLRVGTIDTWWDYKQLATRGVEPPLKFIDSVGRRLEGQRVRLRDAMEAVQTSAIANQTEATRDNTYQLEVIARGIHEIESGLIDLKKKLEVRRYWIYVVATLVGVAITAAGVYFGNAVEIGLPWPKR